MAISLFYGVYIVQNNNTYEILNILEKMYPDAHCELNYNTPFELLVAVILSAQCTDKRVNIITTELFKKYNTPEDFASMDIKQLEKLIYSCGFYHNKAKSIINASREILLNFNGEVPKTVDELMTLSGVGRKTANVVYSVAFGGQAIAVDTHVFRVSKRLGLSDATTPEKTELQLMKLFPKEKWYQLHHNLIFHGRYTCKSQNPNCAECGLVEYCKYIKGEQNE